MYPAYMIKFRWTNGTDTNMVPPMVDEQTQLLDDVEAFLEAREMPATTFGIKAVNDGKFVSRLRARKNMHLSTVARVREFMRAQTVSALRGM
jgi:hypothetical protein